MGHHRKVLDHIRGGEREKDLVDSNHARLLDKVEKLLFFVVKDEN